MMLFTKKEPIKTFRDLFKEVEKAGLLDAYYCGCSVLVQYDEHGNSKSEVFSVCLCDEAINKSKEATT